MSDCTWLDSGVLCGVWTSSVRGFYGLGQGWELADATLIKMLGEANQTWRCRVPSSQSRKGLKGLKGPRVLLGSALILRLIVAFQAKVSALMLSGAGFSTLPTLESDILATYN